MARTITAWAPGSLSRPRLLSWVLGGSEGAVEFRIACACGQSIPVSAGQAGSLVTCQCGATVVVPSFRQLRAAAGLPPPEHPEVAVKRLLQSGRMAAGPCAVCGAGVGAPVECVAECERSIRKSGGGHWVAAALAILLAAVISSWLPLFRLGRDQEPRVFGRDLTLTLPLPLCMVCRGGLTSQADIKKVLCHVPEYRRLLEKYPRAKVRVRREVA